MVLRRSRRRTFVAAAGGVLLAFALATPRPAEADDTGTWNGLYIGGHAGYGWADAEYDITVQGFPTETINHDMSGAVYGGHVGLLHQWDHIVGGVEVSYSALDMSDTVGSSVIRNRFRTIDIDSLVTATARLGYAFGDRLLYVKGGYAGADVDLAVFAGGSTTKSTTGGWADGWIVGVGFEHLCTSRIVLGVEYDYVNFDIDDQQGSLPDHKRFDYTDNDTDMHTVMARLSYKFGSDPAPPPAPLK